MSMNTQSPAALTVPADTWIGIDVSKDTLDACLLRQSGKDVSLKVENTPQGHRKLLAWAKQQARHAIRHFCMESTGTYGQDIALFLANSDERVSVLNPALPKYSGPGGASNKTDKADAKKIARFARAEQPPLWQPPAPEVAALTALVRRLETLKDLRHQEDNRRQTPGLPAPVAASVDETLAFLSQQVAALEQQIRDHIHGHPRLREDQALLTSIPGIGETTAHAILAELPPVEQLHSAQAAAAYAGLSPKEHRSGTSVHKRTRLSKCGNARLRAALYLPAVTACRFNPFIKALWERLLRAGKVKMVAVGAAMRKLLMIAYGVLKHRQPFQKNYRTEAVPAS